MFPLLVGTTEVVPLPVMRIGERGGRLPLRNGIRLGPLCRHNGYNERTPPTILVAVLADQILANFALQLSVVVVDGGA